MAKKRRNRKPYRGKDSSIPPEVIRVEAPERSRFGNWWQDNKQSVIIRLIQIGVVLFLAGLVYLVSRVFF